MPYRVVKQGGKYAIVNRETNEVVGTSNTREKAEASARARMAAHHGWKPTRRKTGEADK